MNNQNNKKENLSNTSFKEKKLTKIKYQKEKPKPRLISILKKSINRIKKNINLVKVELKIKGFKF